MDNKDYREVEILFSLKSGFAEAKAHLEKYEFKGVKQTIDVYYHDSLRQNLQPNDKNQLLECFRLREKGGKYSMAYKVNHFDGDIWLYSDEYETELADLQAAQAIISRLGLEVLVRVENAKHTYRTEDYEIVLEDVKDLGHFLEVEFCGAQHGKNVSDIKHDIRKFIEGLEIEVGEALNDGKPELLLQKKSRQG